MRKLRKDKALCRLIIWSVLTLIVYVISVEIGNRLEDAIVIPTMVCDRYFVPMDFSPEEKTEEVSLQYVKEGAELPGLEFNKKYPCYQNNGATLFLYEGNYNMVFSDFSESEGEAQAVAGEGAVFSEETTEQIGEQVHLLRLVDAGLCVNLKPFELYGEINETLPLYSLISVQTDRISWYEYYRGRLRFKSIAVTPGTMVRLGDMNSTYYEWLAAWEGETVGAPSVTEGFDDSLYFFDMLQKFEINGTSVFRRTEGKRLLLENNDVRYNVHGIALYHAEEDAVILPGGFGIMRPWAKSINSLPELTKLVPDIAAVYLEMPEQVLGINDAFIYSDAGCYILLDSTEYVMGDIRLALAPLSMIIVEDDLRLSVFQYQTKEFKTYTVSGPEPYVELGHGMKLRPLQGSLERSDKTTEVLIATPSILPVLQ